MEQTTKHTPGPWTIDCRDWRGRPSQDLYISGDEYTDSDGEPCETAVAIVLCPETGSRVGNANARLIAAAPDLLAACEAAVNQLIYMQSQADSMGAIGYPNLDSELASRISELRAAIVRAGGGAA